MTAVVASLLQFDRSGTRVIAGDRDVVVVRDVRTGDTTRIECGAVAAVAGFDDQIWIVAAGRLRRHTVDGRAIGESIEVPFAGSPALLPAPHGPLAAVWPSSPPWVVLDDLGELVAQPHAAGDVLIPTTGRRVLSTVHGRVLLPSGAAIDLDAGSRVTGGIVFADGRRGVAERDGVLPEVAPIATAWRGSWTICVEAPEVRTRGFSHPRFGAGRSNNGAVHRWFRRCLAAVVLPVHERVTIDQVIPRF